MKAPRPFISVAYSFLVLSRAEAWHCSVEDQRRRGGSAKGSGNHRNDDNFNAETRRILRLLWQERPFRRRRKKQLTRSAEGWNSEGSKERRKGAIKYRGEVEQGKRRKTLGRKINYIKWQLITDLRLKLRTLEKVKYRE